MSACSVTGNGLYYIFVCDTSPTKRKMIKEHMEYAKMALKCYIIATFDFSSFVLKHEALKLEFADKNT